MKQKEKWVAEGKDEIWISGCFFGAKNVLLPRVEKWFSSLL